MNLWLTVIIIGLLTVAIRVSFILLFGVVDVPSWLRRGLRFVPAAVLSAIIFSQILLTSENQLNLHWGNERLVAGVVAVGVAWRTKNVLLTIALGMVVLWLI